MADRLMIDRLFPFDAAFEDSILASASSDFFIASDDATLSITGGHSSSRRLLAPARDGSRK
jgi:hypothetical protein